MKKLTSKTLLGRLKKEKQKLKEKGVKKIGLFGSYAKDKQKQTSDIDFLVTFDKIDFDDYMELMSFLKKLFRKKIDLVIERNLIPELNYVKKEAKYVEL